MPNLRKENRDLIALLTSIRSDMLMRGTKEEDGTIVVEMSNGIWYRLNQAIDNADPQSTGQPNPIGKLPEHHKQWFAQLQKACKEGNLALMTCLDAKTLEQRSVLTLVGYEDGQYVFTPVGHLSPEDNPYEAYLPPRVEDDEEQEVIR